MTIVYHTVCDKRCRIQLPRGSNLSCVRVIRGVVEELFAKIPEDREPALLCESRKVNYYFGDNYHTFVFTNVDLASNST
ncbi:MAG: hypothetical protein S4CHLAM81_01610 [Chlamydiales bacterium]|nr:hypothetical protein [Chlamydiales bacterium]MCH9634957.1 hypothetical protein [Chlamydiales bacterium]